MVKTKRQLGGLLLIVALMGGPASTAFAQDANTDEISRMTREISQEIYSPYCPGKTLAMCPSANAGDARREIQEMASQGMEKEAIKAELLERYGEGFEVVAPPAEDNAKLLGIIGVGLLLAVFAVVALARRRLSNEEEAAEMAAEQAQDAELEDNEGYLDELRDDYLS